MSTSASVEVFEPARPDYDPFSPEATCDPFPQWERVRAESPVFFSPVLNSWIVSRYDDVRAALQDTARLHMPSGSIRATAVPPALAEIAPAGLMDQPIMDENPAGHQRWRRLANQAFKPAILAAREPAIRAIVDRLIDGFIDAGETDLVANLTTPLPSYLLATMFGLPDSDHHQLLDWTSNSATLNTVVLSGDAEVAVWRKEMDYHLYVERVVEDRRANPRDTDLLTDLIRAEDEGLPAFTTQELVALLRGVISAGNEPLGGLLSTMVLRLLEHPDQLACVRADHSLIPNAIEETLRHSGSARGLHRMVQQDVTLGGVTIPAGHSLQLLFSSANHDDAEFDNPEEFDLHRGDAVKHLGFGKGIHFCLGASLARLAARVMLEQILARLPGLRLTTEDPVGWKMSHIVYVLEYLNVEWETR